MHKSFFERQLEYLLTIFMSVCCFLLSPLGLVTALLFKRKWERKLEEEFLKEVAAREFQFKTIEYKTFFYKVTSFKINEVVLDLAEVEHQLILARYQEATRSLMVELEVQEEFFYRNWHLVIPFIRQSWSSPDFFVYLKYDQEKKFIKARLSWIMLIFASPFVKLFALGEK